MKGSEKWGKKDERKKTTKAAAYKMNCSQTSEAAAVKQNKQRSRKKRNERELKEQQRSSCKYTVIKCVFFRVVRRRQLYCAGKCNKFLSVSIFVGRLRTTPLISTISTSFTNSTAHDNGQVGRQSPVASIYFAVGLGAQHNEQKLRANRKQKKKY